MEILNHTSAMAVDTSLAGQLDNSYIQLQNLELQATTGKQINQPSDNPAGTATALQLNAEISQLSNYSAAATAGTGQLNAADSVLSSISTTLQQVQSDVMQGANASSQDKTTLSALAANVTALKQTLLTDANSNYNGVPLFSGTVNTSPYANASATPPDYTYTGGSVAPTVAVGPGQRVPVGVTGQAVFGSGTGSVFALLDQISSDLTSGNTAALSGTDLTQLQQAMSTASSAQATIGTATDELQTAQTQNTAKSTALQTSVSNVVDANEAVVASQLSLQETQYQAALSIVAKVIQPTLAEYIQ